MAAPSQNDLIFYTNKPLDDADWRANWLKALSWISDGTYDLNFNTLTLTGGATIGGNTTVTGSLTATSFVGDGSFLTGLNPINRNWVFNSSARLKANANYTLVKDVYGTGFVTDGAQAFGHYGMATGTLVSAGVMARTTSANVGSSGYGFRYAGVTLTGAGIVNHRFRLQSKDAINFINQIMSFSCKVYQDTGSTFDYTIIINKANAVDDFGAITQIAAGATSVLSATPTTLKKENVSMGACGNGVEIIVQMASGSCTNKNFELTEFQFEISATATTYMADLFELDALTSGFNYDGTTFRCNTDFGVNANGKIRLGTTAYFIESGGDIGVTTNAGSVITFANDGSITTGSNGMTATAGVYIGVTNSNNLIDDATAGAGSTTLFIGNKTITTSSDVRLKTNIEDTKIDGLSLIDRLRVVDFDWNDKVAAGDSRKQRGRYTGMLAQEVKKIAPWIIHDQGAKDCVLCNSGQECAEHINPWLVEYEHLVPTLVKAIQELSAKVKQLEEDTLWVQP